MPGTTQRPLFERVDDWMKTIDNVKTAAASAPATQPKKVEKQAGPDGMGNTSHPSEKVDNNTHAEQTGARFKENTEDVKKDVPGQAVDETDPKGGGDQDSKQYNIGTQQSATGEDPSVEDDFKSDKDDPGTTHPADAESVGEKYSSLQLGALLKVAADKGNGLLAEIANGAGQPAPVASQPVTQQVAAVKAAAKAEPKNTPPAQIPTPPTDLTKIAEDYVAAIIRDADKDADLVGPFIHAYQQERLKKANEGAAEGESHASDKEEGEESTPAESTGSSEPAPAPGGGDVLSALGAGGAGADAGPPAGMAAGGLPTGGGDPGAGAAGPGGPGGVSHEEALQQLVMALEELGISPEELTQLAQPAPGGAGGAGLGGPAGPPGAEMGGGMPTAAGLGKAARDFKRSGKFRFSEAKTAAQATAREQIKDYIREITGLKS